MGRLSYLEVSTKVMLLNLDRTHIHVSGLADCMGEGTMGGFIVKCIYGHCVVLR